MPGLSRSIPDSGPGAGWPGRAAPWVYPEQWRPETLAREADRIRHAAAPGQKRRSRARSRDGLRGRQRAPRADGRSGRQAAAGQLPGGGRPGSGQHGAVPQRTGRRRARPENRGCPERTSARLAGSPARRPRHSARRWRPRSCWACPSTRAATTCWRSAPASKALDAAEAATTVIPGLAAERQHGGAVLPLPREHPAGHERGAEPARAGQGGCAASTRSRWDTCGARG